MGDLAGQELEEPVELVGVAPQPRRQPRGIGVGRLDRADLELQPVVEALDPAEHAHRVALGEARVEQLDVVPDPPLDATGRVDELQREIRRALPRRPALLPRDGVDALDRAVGSELGDRAHALSLGRGRVGTLPAMAVVKPFRALRYDEAGGRPARDARRAALRRHHRTSSARSCRPAARHNVVRLTLPDSEEEAARALRRVARGRRPGRGAAGGLGARTGLRRPGRDRAHALRDRRVAEGGAVRDRDGAAARAHPRRPEGGPTAPPARHARPARADLPPLRRAGADRRVPIALPTSRSRARSSGGSTTRPSCARSTTSSC